MCTPVAPMLTEVVMQRYCDLKFQRWRIFFCSKKTGGTRTLHSHGGSGKWVWRISDILVSFHLVGNFPTKTLELWEFFFRYIRPVCEVVKL